MTAAAEADRRWVLKHPDFDGYAFPHLGRAVTFTTFRRAWEEPAFARAWRTERDDTTAPAPPALETWDGARLDATDAALTPNQRMGKRAADFLFFATQAQQEAAAFPAWTSREWTRFFENLRRHTRAVHQATEALDPSFFQQAGVHVRPLQATLAALDAGACEALAIGGLPRPHDKRRAERTYVAKQVIEGMGNFFPTPRHDFVAATLNAVFPDLEPVDAVYAQSLQRRLATQG